MGDQGAPHKITVFIYYGSGTKLFENLKITLFEEVETAQQSILKTKNHIENINKQLEAMDTADSCYVCGQPIDNSHTMLMKANLEEDLFTSSKRLGQETTIFKDLSKEKNEYKE